MLAIALLSVLQMQFGNGSSRNFYNSGQECEWIHQQIPLHCE